MLTTVCCSAVRAVGKFVLQYRAVRRRRSQAMATTIIPLIFQYIPFNTFNKWHLIQQEENKLFQEKFLLMIPKSKPYCQTMTRDLSLYEKREFERIKSRLLRPSQVRTGKHCTSAFILVERYFARGPYDRPLLQPVIERLVVEWSDGTTTKYRTSILRNQGFREWREWSSGSDRSFRSGTAPGLGCMHSTVYPSL